MRAVVQRVAGASVTIEGQVKVEIKRGLLVLLGISEVDTEAEAVYLADKCSGLRIFEDDEGKMNISLADIGGEMLVVSNFTLYGDCRKGKRSSFAGVARPEKAIRLYELFIESCADRGFNVKSGVFGADMKVNLINDGPVTLILDTDEMKGRGKFENNN